MRKYLLFIVILIMSFSLAVSAQDYMVSIESNFRDAPNGENIGVLEQGFEITEDMIKDLKGDWLKIQISIDKGYIHGWVSSNNLSKLERKEQYELNKVKLMSEIGMTKVVGEITNNTDNDYTLANFMVTLYDRNGDILNTGYLNISNLASGQTKTFNGYVDSNLSNVDKYKIEFENGI